MRAESTAKHPTLSQHPARCARPAVSAPQPLAHAVRSPGNATNRGIGLAAAARQPLATDRDRMCALASEFQRTRRTIRLQQWSLCRARRTMTRCPWCGHADDCEHEHPAAHDKRNAPFQVRSKVDRRRKYVELSARHDFTSVNDSRARAWASAASRVACRMPRARFALNHSPARSGMHSIERLLRFSVCDSSPGR